MSQSAHPSKPSPEKQPVTALINQARAKLAGTIPPEWGAISAEWKRDKQGEGKSGPSAEQITKQAVIAALGLSLFTSLAAIYGLSANLSTGWSTLAILSGFVSAFSAFILFTTATRPQNLIDTGELVKELNETVEQMSDAQWELRDSEARYRDLLNCQNDIIIRRDKEGRLTYTNSAFMKLFGKSLDAKIGTEFTPKKLEGPKAPALTFEPGQGRRSYTQQLETSSGPRWFNWEEFAIRDNNHELYEVQSIGRDITEQKRAEQQLEEARDLAESANRAKGQFMATMSHEIRTPMNGILGMTGLMMDTSLTAEQKTYCRAINSSAKSLLSLIDQILDFSKIEAGKLELDNQPFDLRETAQSVIELLAPRAHDKGLELGWFFDPSLPKTLIGDEVRIRQILTNLIGNAIKFTENGGITIELRNPNNRDKSKNPFSKSTTSHQQSLELIVKDTGIGLSEKAQQTVFDEFEQADGSHARRFEGTGLGLAITKRIAEKMSGAIKVVSQPDEGATFTVMLQLGRPEGAAGLYQSFELPKSASKILVAGSLAIEMSAIIRTLTAAGLVARHCSAETAIRNLAAARKSGQPFDTLILDAPTAKNRGKKLIAELEKTVSKEGMTIAPKAIVLLDVSERGEFPKLQKEGITGYLTRPVRATSLFARLNETGTLEDDKRVSSKDTAAFFSPPVISTGPRILLAEDNDINALLARTILTKLGATVEHVTNGEEAVARVVDMNKNGKTLDGILMDIHMPEMDGFTATEIIRSTLQNEPGSIKKNIPIIAMTANAFPEDREKCLAAGMNDHLAKPFEAEQLRELLNKWQVTVAGAHEQRAEKKRA